MLLHHLGLLLLLPAEAVACFVGSLECPFLSSVQYSGFDTRVRSASLLISVCSEPWEFSTTARCLLQHAASLLLAVPHGCRKAAGEHGEK